MERLGLAAQRVDGARVLRAKIAGVLVEGFVSDEHGRRHIEHAVLGIELLDSGATTRRVTFAEDLPDIAKKQFVSTVLHDGETLGIVSTRINGENVIS